MRSKGGLASAASSLRVLLLIATLAVVVAAPGVVVALPAAAHHSWTSDYDGSKPVTVEGVVTKVEWTNPHVHIYVDVSGEGGTVTNWNFEMASVLSLERGGWSRRTLAEGDEVTVGGYSGRAVAERAIASSITTSDGRALFVGTLGN